MNERSVEELAAKVCGALATTSPEDAFDRVADYAVARAAQILAHGAASVHCTHALAAAQLVHAEEPMLLAYASNHLEHARLVVVYAGLCGIRENVAWFALVKMLNPSRFAAGALSDFRPLGRRADVDREIRLVETLYRRWLRRAAVAFMVAYWLLGDPPTSGEIQTPARWHPPSEKLNSLWWPRFPVTPGHEQGRAARTTTKFAESPTGFYPQPYPRTTP